ncbi:hypothetical protein BJY04DRAFT_190444 [Aspergillus karnatakaensis]|uniref:uncharacterized protein n=1 Tax=Aspergillus karnatakaensis TaxID=1810916 RepID=UPI003CCD7C0F
MSASALGESWVVASVYAERDQHEEFKTSQIASDPENNHGSESMITASTSSMSGPELIMPSIYETPIAEKSWIAPNVRMKQHIPYLRRKPQTSAEPTIAKPSSDVPERHTHLTMTPKAQTQSRVRRLEFPVRILLNIILVAAISHLLVLPEVVQQCQSLCSIGPFSTLYPASCIFQYHHTYSPRKDSQSAPPEAVISSQTRLEILFNATLHEIAPLNGSLKQTESQLRIVERDLKHAHPGTKHELDLEFESCWRAIRIAAWKFDSLKVDLQSAVESLIAAGEVKPKHASTASRSSVAHDARLSTQILRREQYVDQLMARMRSRADSLVADLATLDDHLESIESIVGRETTRSSSSPSSEVKDSSTRLRHFADAIILPNVPLPSFLRARDGGQPQNGDDTLAKLTLSQIFHKATTHHPLIAKLAKDLSKQLQQSLRPRKNDAI